MNLGSFAVIMAYLGTPTEALVKEVLQDSNYLSNMLTDTERASLLIYRQAHGKHLLFCMC